MHRRKKQLLGLAGLALVAALTALACIIPAPGASASSVNTKVKVQVQNDGRVPYVRIISLENDDVVLRKSFTVTIGYTRATELKVFIKNNGAIAGVNTVAETEPQEGEQAIDLTGSTCGNITYSSEEQTCEVAYELPGDLSSLTGVNFVTRAVATNGSAGDSSDASIVEFTYRKAYLLEFDDKYVENGDPSLKARFGDGIQSAYIAFCKLDGDECDRAVKFKYPDFIDSETGMYKLKLDQKEGDSLKFALPLWESDAPEGEYRVVLMAYSTDGPSENGLIAVSVVDDVVYKIKNTNQPGPNEPDPNLPEGPNNPNNPNRPGGPNDPNTPDDPNNPDAPNTGASLFRELNISQADYIITGIVAFGLVTGFAVFLMLRRSKR